VIAGGVEVLMASDWLFDLVFRSWELLHQGSTHLVALIEFISNIDNGIVILAYASAFVGKSYLAVVILGYVAAVISRGPFLLLGGAVMGNWWAASLAALVLVGLCVKHFMTSPDENAPSPSNHFSQPLKGMALVMAIIFAVLQTASIDLACAGENVLAALSIARGDTATAWVGTVEGMIFTGLSLPVLKWLVNRLPGLEDGAFAVIGVIGVFDLGPQKYTV
jgi:predicted tellurium resistance membrane protein TerC